MNKELSNLERAKVYIGMADKIQLGRFKEKYYKLALEALEKALNPDPVQETAESTVAAEQPEQTPEEADRESGSRAEAQKQEAEVLQKETEHKLNEARAAMVIEKYDFACKSREYAKTSEDQGSAALHFKDAKDALDQISVDVEDLSPEIRAAYEEVKNAEEARKVCEKKAEVTYQAGRVKLLLGLAAAAALVIGAWTSRETVTFNTGLANVLSMIGMKTTAADFYEKAYERHADDNTYANYIKGLYEAGVKENKKGDAEETIKYLHLPALEAYEDAAGLCTAAELSLMDGAAVGDEVTFAGVRWYVLETGEESLTLLKEDGISCGAFNSSPKAGDTWENSELRAYLNSTYLTDNFNTMEQEYLTVSQVAADDNGNYGTDGGADTEDTVYILSASETEKFGDLVNKCGHMTWLRTPGAEEGTFAFVDTEHTIMYYGYDESSEALYCKPVIQVSVAQ